MANKRKLAKKRGPSQITAAGTPSEGQTVALAGQVLCPTVQAAVTLQEYGQCFGDVDVTGLADCLRKQTQATIDGDLKRGETMLTAQAHTLDAIFNNLARWAINCKHVENADCYLKLALRAQSQCRATWEALATIKNPPMVGYVKQANIAHGHQQVNNAPFSASGAPPARENPNPQNELLEEKNDEWLDTGATGTPSQTDI